jgi:type II secretory pathway pseudopilin PulG
LRPFRRALTAIALAATLTLSAAPAWAGSPHFVNDQTTFAQDGATLTVTFKEAGLGDELQVDYLLEAQFQCVNPGGNDPQAGNKQSFQTAQTLPVQNGQVSGSLSVTAVLQPKCEPPMAVVVRSATLTDTTNGISVSL